MARRTASTSLEGIFLTAVACLLKLTGPKLLEALGLSALIVAIYRMPRKWTKVCTKPQQEYTLRVPPIYPPKSSPFPLQLQIVSGAGLEAYWLSSFAWDFVSYLVPMSLAIILFKAVGLASLFDNGAVNALILLFLLFGLSMVRQRRRYLGMHCYVCDVYEAIHPLSLLFWVAACPSTLPYGIASPPLACVVR